jgi:hypothetical protein
MNLGDNFYDDLTALIEKYSGMEMTNAEAVGYLEFKKFELLSQLDEDKEEWE